MDQRKQGRIDILLNNTVLSNFARVNRLNLLETAISGTAATTEAVLKEFNEGITLGYMPSVPLDWVTVLSLSPEERQTFQVINLRLGEGEASCLAVAQHRGMSVATDDMDARRHAQRAGISVSGTLGILVHLVRSKTLNLQEANSILAEMIQHGYRAPVADLSSLVN